MSKLYTKLSVKLPKVISFIITILLLSVAIILIYAYSIAPNTHIGYINI